MKFFIAVSFFILGLVCSVLLMDERNLRITAEKDATFAQLYSAYALSSYRSMMKNGTKTENYESCASGTNNIDSPLYSGVKDGCVAAIEGKRPPKLISLYFTGYF